MSNNIIRQFYRIIKTAVTKIDTDITNKWINTNIYNARKVKDKSPESEAVG